MNKRGLFFTFVKIRGRLFKHNYQLDDLLFDKILEKHYSDVFPFLRLVFLLLVTTAFLFIAIFRLIYLQIFEGEKYKKIAEGNRIYVKKSLSRRGVIYDRFGKILVVNKAKYVLKSNEKSVEIEAEKAMKMEVENPKRYQEIVEYVPKREYQHPKELSHLLGYLGEINAEELSFKQFAKYSQGDQIGRGGIEEYYENVLRGENGEEYYEVNSSGEIINKLGEKKGTSGKDIKLTIDFDLQKTAYDAILDVKNDLRYQGGDLVKGAVVVSSVSNGEILAMVSLPSFDVDDVPMAILDSENFPLMNRAISATYPPGSTFKIAVATAGLESGRVKRDTLVEDVGIIKIGQWEFPTWSSIRDGMVDVVMGIKRSNDIFFYRAGEMTGLTNIVKYAKQFGLGEKLGIDLPAEAIGNLPSDAWKFENTGEHWYLGDTYHLAIGQGYILTTPLQVNSWTNVIAARGKLYRPHVVLNSKSQIPNSKQKSVIANLSLSKVKQSFKQIATSVPSALPRNDESEYLIRDLRLRKETIDLIWRGMKEACQPGGTGWPLFDFSVPVACKTGTAEHLVGEGTHAWFTAFAPADKPEIVVTVLIENGGQGSDVAAPVARKIMEKYFNVK